MALALSGCTHKVHGDVVGMHSRTQTDVRLQSIEQTLPDTAELSRAVDSPMKIDYVGRPGRLEALPHGMGDATPIECLGAYRPRMRQVYEQAPLSAAIDARWQTITGPDQIPDLDVGIDVGVLEFDSSASAHSWYSKFVSQWQQCEGKAVVNPGAGSDPDMVAEITRVAEVGGVLSDVVLVTVGDGHGDDPLVEQRALTSASRYVVDVRVVRISGHTASVTSDDAVAVARLIAARIISTQ